MPFAALALTASFVLYSLLYHVPVVLGVNITVVIVGGVTELSKKVKSILLIVDASCYTVVEVGVITL